MVDEGGTWARFRVQPRLKSKIGADGVARLRKLAEAVSGAYEVDGEIGFSREGRLSVDTLRTWAAEMGGIIRISHPRVAIDTDLDALWAELFKRYVGPPRREALVAEAPTVTGVTERRHIVAAFLATNERWHNFDRTRVLRDQPFDGPRTQHIADLAIMNGRVSAVAEALPLVHGSPTEVIQSRALLVDLALGLPGSVLKLGLYEDPPEYRRNLLVGIESELGELGEARAVELVPVRQVDSLGSRFEERLFPALGSAPDLR